MVKSEGSREPGRTASKEELNAFADDGVSEVCENEQVFATWVKCVETDSLPGLSSPADPKRPRAGKCCPGCLCTAKPETWHGVKSQKNGKSTCEGPGCHECFLSYEQGDMDKDPKTPTFEKCMEECSKGNAQLTSNIKTATTVRRHHFY